MAVQHVAGLPYWGKFYAQEGGGSVGGEELHSQIFRPKEKQHASPGGHLFSQVCSPNAIKIGAAYPLSNAALVR